MSSGNHCKSWLAVILLAAAPVPAQDEVSIRVDVDLVSVLCTVRDSHGGLVSHLRQDDFVVVEEGKPQIIRHFEQETGLPLTVGLLVDTSNSQIRLIDDENRAAAQFFDQVIRPKDAAFLMSFDAATKVVMEHANTRESIKEGLERLRQDSPHWQPHHGTGRPRGTLLYDAVYQAAQDKLRKEPGRKAIVVITDGMDVGSRLKIDDAIDAAQKADVMIYSIYYVDSKLHGGSDWDNRQGRSILREMSEQTGGRFFRVDHEHPLKKVFDQIQQEMRSQYSFSFSSDDKKDGKYHRLEVFLRQPGLTAQARKGYYAARSDESR
jgi:VWFA-related protein